MRQSYRESLSVFKASELAAAGSAGTLTYRSASSGIGFQDGGPGSPQAIILVGPDDAGDGIGLAPGNPVITVGAPPTVGTIGTNGDQDFFQVTLQAGTTYEIGMFSKSGGPNLFGLPDAYIELYSSTGQLRGSSDGGASTTINMVNSGFDAVLTVEVTTTGTYYINARAFDNDPNVGGSTGEGVGDYDLYVNVVDPNDPNVYHPYYDASSPLYAIDWGTQVNKVNQSVRNPDGDEGTRDTGNAPGTPVYGNPSSISALAAAQGVDISGKNVITIYFAQAGDVFTSIEDPTSPGLPPVLVSVGTEQWERDTVWTALHEFEKVADVVYIEVPTREEADFFFTTYAGTPGPGVSLLGSMSPPDYPDEGLAQFNSGDYRWTEENLQQGGFSYVTLIHEFGHGHGLAHPHDNGGHSGIMNGVESDGPVADYTTGDYDLNQGIHTMMSYEDGWQTSPYGNAATDAGYGYLGGLMAFDIAAIQDKYGVNEEWATGHDTYTLKDVNAAGTFFASIWDGGGTDRIVYSGARNTTIDLRPATLEYEVGGGGFVSYAYGIYGGFTVANGVVIENAVSGSGHDTLIGNAADNVLDSGAGTDRLDGGAGADLMIGGTGNDTYVVDTRGDRVVEAIGGGNDRIDSSVTFYLLNSHEVETLALTGTGANSAYGNDRANTLIGNSAANLLDGGLGTDVMEGGLGDDRFYVDVATDTVRELAGQGDDIVYTSVSYGLRVGVEVETLGTRNAAGTEALTLAGNEFANSVIGNAGNNALYGNGGADYLVGGAGNDQLDGGTGVDFMDGGLSDDRYYVDSATDVVRELAGQGNDLVYTSVSYTLRAGAEVELLGTRNAAETEALTLTGNEFDNDVIGNAGVNALNGGGGSDSLSGLGGNDVLDGGAGRDFLYGGTGADRFVLASISHSTVAASDLLSDFAAGTDKLDLSGIDARSGTVANDAFAWIGNAAFSGVAGQLRAAVSGSQTWVYGDVNGDGTADFAVTVNSTTLTSGDFIF